VQGLREGFMNSSEIIINGIVEEIVKLQKVKDAEKSRFFTVPEYHFYSGKIQGYNLAIRDIVDLLKKKEIK
jgi:hypothetical protein